MAIVRKPGSRFWWIDITVPEAIRQQVGKARIRESTELEATPANKPQAQQLHDKVKNDLWRQDKLGEAPTYTLRQAIARWKKYAAAEGIADARNIEKRLDWWGEQLGLDTPLPKISRRLILDKVEGLTCQPNKYRPDTAGKPATAATINHYLKTIRGLLLKCAGPWEMLESPPSFKEAMRPEPKGRVRALTLDQVKLLLGELPEHWRPIIMFALATGLRKDNVVRLEWSQVDLARRRLLVGSEEFKNGEDFGIPLNDTAAGILEAQQGQHDTRVFTYQGEPMAGLTHRTWKKALRKAGIDDFRWHDNRHTWATMLIEAGVELEELQKLGGWKSREMVLRYAHFRTEHLRGASSRIDKGLGDLIKPKQQVTIPTAAALRHSPAVRLVDTPEAA